VQAATSISLSFDPAWIVPATRRTRRYLRCLRCPHDLVDDFVQETMLAALRHWKDTEPPLAWLFATARNAWFQDLRARRRTALLAELPELHAAAVRELADDGGDWRLQALAACVGRLAPRAQLALRLRYREGMSPPALAHHLGMTSAGAKSLLRRTKIVLGRCVEQRRQSDA
jgi:RNA polymerase sigma-70 factor, ECF subfamily